MRRVGSFGLLSALACAAAPAAAQRVPFTASAAYDSIQITRDRAESLWTKGDMRGIALLESALGWMNEQAWGDLARGNIYLTARRPDVYFDLAHAHMMRGDTARALDAIERIASSGGSPVFARLLQNDTAFAGMRDLPRFRNVVAQLQGAQRRWSDSAFVTPLRPSLPVEERLAGLSLLWAEARYGFAGFGAVPRLDWDSLYTATIPKVIAATDTWEYYRVLRQMVAQLHDSHTGVTPPARLIDSLWIRPPVRFGKTEGRVILQEVTSPTLTTLGLVPGQELIAIDGIPVEQYVTERVLPTVAWATPQDRDVRAYFYEMLRGPRNVPVRLSLRSANGGTAEVAVPRMTYADQIVIPPVEWRRLPGDIGYVALNTFGVDSIPEKFDRAMQALGPVKALVIDVRRNGGGNSDPGWAVLSRFAEKDFTATQSRLQAYLPTYRAWGMGPMMPIFLDLNVIAPHKTIHHAMPIAVLQGPMTFSAAEDFAAVYKMMKRGLLVGEPSGGNTGQPLSFPLPGGGSARVRTKHDSYVDGTEFIDIGIQPDVLIRPTVAGIRAGKDEVLDAAVARLVGKR